MRVIKLSRGTIVFGVIIVVLLVVIGILAWKYTESTKVTGTKEEQVAESIERQVATIYALPTDETPTIARIQDKKLLGDQQFFTDAQNGDYLLLYKQKKLALIYREKDKKLINVGPINLTNDAKPEGSTAGATTEESNPAQ